MFRAPGVYVNEFDFTEVAPVIGLATLAAVGGASKGVPNEPTFITSEQELIAHFGRPLLTDYGLQAALVFLRKGNRLLYTRVTDGTETRADIPVPGLSGGTPAEPSEGSISFTGSANPTDGETITLRKTVPLISLVNDANGALGNVVITATGAVLDVVGMSGGTVSAPATGEIRFLGGANPADGDEIVISDGTTVVTFEFDSDASVVEGANLRQVVIAADPYATMANLIAKIAAHAFAITATDAVVSKTFEFDSNASFGAGNVGVLIGPTAAATLLNLINAINLQDSVLLPESQRLGYAATDATVTIPELALVHRIPGTDGNATHAETAAAVGLTAMTGGADAIAGSNMTVMGLYAASAGTWGNSIQVVLSATAVIGAPAGRFDLRVLYPVDDSGTLATVERYFNLSLDSSSDRFIETVLAEGLSGEFNASTYITADVFAGAGVANAATYALGTGAGAVGTDGLPSAPAHYVGTLSGQTATGLQALRNPDTHSFNILAIPGVTHRDVITAMFTLAHARQDALVLVDPPFGLSRDEVLDWHNGEAGLSIANAPTAPLDTSYGALYWSWVKDVDQYNGRKEIWLPPSGYAAGVMSYTDTVAFPWFPAAGHNRGVIDGKDIEYSPDQEERELLGGGQNRVNPIAEFQTGLTIFGNRTLLRRTSDLADVSVRRLLLYAQSLVRESVKYLVFEPNDPLTWRRFELLVTPIMEHIRSNRGLARFQVVANGSTTTAEKRARRTLNGKILIEVILGAEVIETDFALFATGAEFTTNF